MAAMTDSLLARDERRDDPDELEDRADELEIEARRLRQKARHLRRAGTSIRWLDDAACRDRYGHSIRPFVEAAKRGEIEIGRAGRSPRVREDVADRYVASRAARKAKTTPAVTDADVYELAVARATRTA